MTTYDAQAYTRLTDGDGQECDGCDFHRAGLELAAALLAHLHELEQLVASHQQRLDRLESPLRDAA
jgi:hypothetical protein